MTRSFTKSEYAQPLVYPKQNFVDTDIEYYRYMYSVTQPDGV